MNLLESVGQTPAIDASVYAWMDAEPYLSAIEYKTPPNDRAFNKIGIVVPNSPQKETFSLAWPERAFKKMAKLQETPTGLLTKPMYTFRGYIYYTDIFDIRYRTDFWFIADSTEPGLKLRQVREGAPAYVIVEKDAGKGKEEPPT